MEEKQAMDVAATILQQLGGRKFLCITGSKQPSIIKDGLRLNLSRNNTSANRLDIVLDYGTDTYKMRFWRMTFSTKTFEVKTKEIKQYSNIYCDQLEDIFSDTTGLVTRL